MKKSIIVISFIFLLFIISCNSNSIEEGNWKGSDTIAGIGFDFELTTKNGDFSLTGNGGGNLVNDKGGYYKKDKNTIELLEGEFKGTIFKFQNDKVLMFLDNGDYFMTLK